MLVPTHSPTVLLLCGSVPSNLSRLPGRAFLSACRQYPVLPVPAVCRVLSCRVVSVARLFSLVLFGCSFARLVPCTATNQTVAVTFPPLPLFRTLSLPPHKSRPIDFSPAATSQPQPSHWKPSLLGQLIGQLSQLHAKASRVRGNLLRRLLCFFLLKPGHREAGANQGQGQGQVQSPQDLVEGTDIQRGKE